MTSQPKCQVSSDGTKYWWLNGQLHRTDGPAIEDASGTKEWWLNDNKLDLEEAVKNLELKLKYPKLTESIIIYSVHNS
jgi:hypothetical protein